MKTSTKSLFLSLLLLPSVRVAIFKEAPKVTIKGKELWVRTFEPRPITSHIDTPTDITATEEGFKIGEQLFAYPFLQIESQDETVSVNNKTFKGIIEIRRSPNNGLLILNELPLEKYLIGLVHGEIASSWPMEVIKAQAVAARTYALFRQKQRQTHTANYDLESDTADQVYVGSMGDVEDRVVQEAVEATQGEILWYLGLYPAYFHSCCGGQTETANRVWGKKDPSRSIIDPYCKNSPYHDWELKLSQRQFLNALKNHGLTGSRIKSLTLERYEDEPRNAMVMIETDEMTLFLGATELRRILGYKEMKSTWFDVDWTPREVKFTGTGYGHGVGMCQWGAKAMAESGADYKTILQFYYPKAVVRKVY